MRRVYWSAFRRYYAVKSLIKRNLDVLIIFKNSIFQIFSYFKKRKIYMEIPTAQMSIASASAIVSVIFKINKYVLEDKLFE